MPDWNILRCPACSQTGSLDSKRWMCQRCERPYPRYGDVIDFRVAPARTDLSFAHLETKRKEDERIARALALSQAGSLADMVANYFSEFPTLDFIQEIEGETLLAADQVARGCLLQMEQEIPFERLCSRDPSAFLEVGCGSAGLTRSLSPRFTTVVAMDADLDRMVVAQKACREYGIQNAILVCAFGEQMPFALGSFDLISAMQVLEHVTSQEHFLQGIHSVLRPSGYLHLTTPNRFSLGAEPHVRLWGLGFLPRRWMSAYVRFRIGLPYEGKHNLSYWELKRLLGRHFKREFHFCKDHPQSYSRLGRAANLLIRFPIVGAAVQLVRSGHEVVAQKPATQ
jgi:2-polyprenyl-3-methyl-5-hydroxy-6-metoxy-1,4-benzoquinol methylase